MPKATKAKSKGLKNSTKPESTLATSRKIKQPTYKSFRVSKRIHAPKGPIKGSIKLFAASTRLVIKNWKLFGGITVIYLVLTILLVKGFGVTTNIAQLKDNVSGAFHGNAAELATGLGIFSVLLSNVGSAPSDVASTYQTMLLIIISLVLIWALRHTLATKSQKVRVRDAYYKGMTPLVPFLIVLLIIGVQLMPLVMASFLYSAVIDVGLAVTIIEKALWVVFMLLLSLLSLYMLTSSIFALYIVTLPNITPMQALRTARDLVRHRRLIVMRKILFLPLALLVLAALIIIPFIIVSPNFAEWLFFVLSMFTLAIAHSYIYHLYRELL